MKSALGVLSCNCEPSLGSTTFNADQVIGKTLMAKKTIALKNLPQDAAPTMATVAPGQPVGSVYSYVNPAPGRTNLYWQITGSGKTYWVKHEIGAFDVTDLKVQGAKTAEQILAEKRAAEEKENDPVLFYVKKIGMPLAIGAGAVYVLTTLGKTFLAAKLANKPALAGPGNSKMWWLAGGVSAVALIGGTWYYFKTKKQAQAVATALQTNTGTNANSAMFDQRLLPDAPAMAQFNEQKIAKRTQPMVEQVFDKPTIQTAGQRLMQAYIQPNLIASGPQNLSVGARLISNPQLSIAKNELFEGGYAKETALYGFDLLR